MSMLAAPDTITGPLTVADLDAAREHSSGNVWLMPRRFEPGQVAADDDIEAGWMRSRFPDTVPTDYGVPGWLDSCAPEGGKARDPVESMARYRQTASTVRWGFALAAALAVLGYVARVVWPIT